MVSVRRGKIGELHNLNDPPGDTLWSLVNEHILTIPVVLATVGGGLAVSILGTIVHLFVMRAI